MGKYLISKHNSLFTKSEVDVIKVDCDFEHERADMPASYWRKIYRMNRTNAMLDSLGDISFSYCEKTPRIPIKTWKYLHTKSMVLMEVIPVLWDATRNRRLKYVIESMANDEVVVHALSSDEVIITDTCHEYVIMTEFMQGSRYTTTLTRPTSDGFRKGRASYLNGLDVQLTKSDKVCLSLLCDVPIQVMDDISTYYDVFSLRKYLRCGVESCIKNVNIKSKNEEFQESLFKRSSISFRTVPVDNIKASLIDRLIDSVNVRDEDHPIYSNISANYEMQNKFSGSYYYVITFTAVVNINQKSNRLRSIDYTPFINILKLNNIPLASIELEHTL